MAELELVAAIRMVDESRKIPGLQDTFTEDGIVKRLRTEAERTGSHINRDGSGGYKTDLRWDDDALKGYEIGDLESPDSIDEKLFLPGPVKSIGDALRLLRKQLGAWWSPLTPSLQPGGLQRSIATAPGRGWWATRSSLPALWQTTWTRTDGLRTRWDFK